MKKERKKKVNRLTNAHFTKKKTLIWQLLLAAYFKSNITWVWIMLYFKNKNRPKQHDISYILIWTAGWEVLVGCPIFVRYCMYIYLCIEMFVIQINYKNNTNIFERYIIQIKSLHRCKTIYHYEWYLSSECLYHHGNR